MTNRLPGLLGVEHVGLTVPDIEAATAFFVDVLGAEMLFEVGPFSSDDDWMKAHLGVHPRAVILARRRLVVNRLIVRRPLSTCLLSNPS